MDDLDGLDLGTVDGLNAYIAAGEGKARGLPPGVLRCRQCSGLFLDAGHGRPPKYCSNACRQKAYRRRRILNLAKESRS